MLEQIFNAPTIVAPTTTLAHIATIPVIMEEGDAIILDHQVHNTVQNATNLLKFRGIHIELMRHNNTTWLEDRIKILRQRYKRVWYMSDGIYSMYGDKTPIDTVYELLDKYPEFYFYNDDAHGMSCFGKHGRGCTLNGREIHSKMILTTSFAKAFATGGSAIVFPNREWADKVKNTGGPFLSSGPLQPASVAAAVECAKIHLTDEIYTLQEELQEKIKFTNLMLKKYNLPSVDENDTPIFFVAVSLPKVGYNMIQRLLKDGFYTNIGIFPTVPIKNTGIRFTITRLNTFEQIENMIEAMAFHYPLAMKEEGFSIDKVYAAFKMSPPEDLKMDTAVSSLILQSNLTITHKKKIEAIGKETWNTMFLDRGTMDYDGMRFLEDAFSNNELPEENWTFDYLTITDSTGMPVLATFFTSTIAKDDMLSPAGISLAIEQERELKGKYYLTSKLLCMGSLLTEGNHLYLDKTSPFWKEALKLMFDKIAELQEKYKVSATNLRDFSADDTEMDSIFIDNGYFKSELPDNHVINSLNWNTKDEFIQLLSKKKRKHIRGKIITNEEKYVVNVFHEKISNKQLSHLYKLYLNVKSNNFAINTFDIPFSLFEEIKANPLWEIVTLELKPEYTESCKTEVVSFFFAYKGKTAYSPMIAGIDYRYQKEHQCYRQLLYQATLRAHNLGSTSLRFGYSASIEKQKLGASVISSVAYLQINDHYNLEVISSMTEKSYA
ncbi:MAG: aminotransferase class I/II-fold pyridoxal phosphate-dependent enzyme [Flavobacteriales bacterium]|nr:aminotransferase class I/II-fold pyridoxal phosphate-dependent enzyme [Flavobacteriales bacterium]